MRSLHDHFRGVPDLRRAKGRKHGIANVLALVAGATLSDMRGLQGHLGVAEHAESGEPGTVAMPVSQRSPRGAIADGEVRDTNSKSLVREAVQKIP